MTTRRHAGPRGVTHRPTFWLLAAAALVALVIVFDGTWLKPAVQRYVYDHSQRRIDFAKLHIGLTSRLQPTVRFEDVTISNAAWADTEAPLIHAGEMQFIFAWRTLIDERTTVSRLVLRDAQIDLERQVDGHRNWRLSNPDDVGPGKVRILALQAERSSLRFVHRGIALDVSSHIDPVPQDEARSSGTALPISQRIAFHGTRRGIAFDGRADVGDALTFYDTGLPFALRGEARSASLRLTVDGRIADIAELGSADAQVQLSGTRLADLALLWAGAEAAEPLAALAYAASGHWQTTGEHTTVEGLQMHLGNAAMTGELGFWRSSETRPRPRVHAALHGATVDGVALDQLLQTLHAKPASTDAKASAGHGMKTTSLTRLDADLQLAIDRLELPRVGAADKVQLKLVLNDGRLDVDPLSLDLAGGQVSASAHLVPNERGARLNLQLALVHLELNRLLAGVPDADRVTGRLDAQARLDAQGESITAWRSSADGDASLSLQGATIADRLEAKLEMSGGAILRTLDTHHEQVPMRCASMSLTLHDGVVSAKRLGLETDHLAVVGQGSFDLRSDSLDLLLTPRRKQSAVLALDRSIKVAGPITAPKLALVDRVELPAAQGCETTEAEGPAPGPTQGGK